jgi:hypothetical protein
MLEAVELEHHIGTEMGHLLRQFGSCNAHLLPSVRPHVSELHCRAHLVLGHPCGCILVLAAGPGGASGCGGPCHSISVVDSRNLFTGHIVNLQVPNPIEYLQLLTIKRTTKTASFGWDPTCNQQQGLISLSQQQQGRL